MKPMAFDGELNYGCLLCRTGSEKQVIREIRERMPEVNVIVARQRRVVCINGVHSVDTVDSFPGYVFFSARKDLDIGKLQRIKEVKEVVSNPDGTWMLEGEARALAAFLFSNEHYNNIF